MENNLRILFCCQTGKTSLVWFRSVCLEFISVTHFQQQLGWWNRVSTFEQDTKLRGVSQFLEDKVRAQNNLTGLKNGLKSINWNSVCAIREEKLNGEKKNGRKLGSNITELELGVLPCKLSNNTVCQINSWKCPFQKKEAITPLHVDESSFGHCT